MHITHIRPPIPLRDFDWAATQDDYEPGCPIGYGRTREEAVADLEEQLAELADDYLCRVATQCETARSDDWQKLVRACNQEDV